MNDNKDKPNNILSNRKDIISTKIFETQLKTRLDIERRFDILRIPRSVNKLEDKVKLKGRS